MALELNGTTGVSLIQDGVITDANLPSGSVLQVVSFNTSSQGSVSVSTSDVALSPDITKSITPIGNNSNFLIQVRWAGEVTWNAQWNSLFNIHRDGSRINAPGTNHWQGLTSPGLLYITNDNDSTGDQMSLSTLDTTGSTAGTAITYRLVAVSNTTYTFYTNRTFGSTGQTSYEAWSSEIIISEIKT